jgi:hypothetical protein
MRGKTNFEKKINKLKKEHERIRLIPAIYYKSKSSKYGETLEN